MKGAQQRSTPMSAGECVCSNGVRSTKYIIFSYPDQPLLNVHSCSNPHLASRSLHLHSFTTPSLSITPRYLNGFYPGGRNSFSYSTFNLSLLTFFGSSNAPRQLGRSPKLDLYYPPTFGNSYCESSAVHALLIGDLFAVSRTVWRIR